jgi:FkbM family methyltransferase
MLWREIFEAECYAAAAAGLRAGDVLLDVGAHTGLSALYFATHTPGVRVLAFEPAPATYECLTRNTAAHLDGVLPLPVAVGETEGEVPFVYYPQAPSQSGRYADRAADDRLTIDYLRNGGLDEQQAAYLCADLHVGEVQTVPLRTLSTIVAEHALASIALLKIDVERAELDVLAGIDDTDWPRVQCVVAEVHAVDGRLERCLRLLADRGFHVESHQEDWLTGTELHTVLAVRR